MKALAACPEGQDREGSRQQGPLEDSFAGALGGTGSREKRLFHPNP